MLSIEVTQERVGAPAICTVQAPQSAIPQPNFVPVMPSTSRNTQSSGVSPSTSTLCALPLTLMVKAMVLSPALPSDPASNLVQAGFMRHCNQIPLSVSGGNFDAEDWGACTQPGDSERQIDDLDPLVRVDDAFAPDRVEIGERLFRNGFLGGFSRGLQCLNAIARSDEHVPEFREVRFVAERAVPRNNLGGIAGERENFVGGGNHAGDCAARIGVDVGIYAVEKRVTHRNNVGLVKMNVEVRVRMCGSKMLEREG